MTLWPFVVLAVLVAEVAAGLLGALAALGTRLDLASAPLAASLGFLCLGPLAFYVVAMERGKSAPALRSPAAPWVLFALAYLCVGLSGDLGSPLWAVYPLLALALARNAGPMAALGPAALVTLLESFPVWMQAHSDGAASPGVGGIWPRALTLAFPLLGWTLGALFRAEPGPRPAAVGDPGDRGVRPDRSRDKEASGERNDAPPPRPAPPSLAPTTDPGPGADPLERRQARLLDLAFHSHPDWNSLGLWRAGADAAELWTLRMRRGRPRTRARVAVGEGYLGLALRERRAIGMDSLSPTACAALPYAEPPYEVGSLRAVPLLDEGRLVGLLCCDRAEPGAFDADACAALDALGGLVVGELQAAGHLQRLTRSGERSRMLYEASKALSLDLERPELLERFGALLKGLVPCDSWALGMREEEGGALRRIAGEGYRGDAPEALSLDRSAALSATLAQAEGAVLFNAPAGAAAPAAFLEGLDSSPRNFLLAPLRMGGRLAGVLKLDRAAEPFTEEERDAAYIFASQAAVTLEHARLYALHRKLATTDGLTGLYNHRYFQERLAEELGRALRVGEPLSLALTDIDFFKKFNDTFGHQEGDVVLRKVATLLREGVRRDTDVVARYGGEEFVVIMPGCDIVEARERMDALRADCAARLSGGQGEQAQRITLSVGLATFPQAAREQRDLIHLADEALYKAKHTGRNRVCSFKDL